MKRPSKDRSVPWITPDGYLDFGKLPVDSILRQTLSSEIEAFRSGCRVLGSMVANGRSEAGVYLVGLLRYYGDELERLEVIVEELGRFQHESSAEALLGELRRVKSSNKTRRYLDRVLRSIERLPEHLVKSGLRELIGDTTFTPRMRAKFRAALERVEGSGW